MRTDTNQSRALRGASPRGITMGKINCSIEQLAIIAAGLIREGMLFEVLVDDENALITITGY